MPLPLLLDAPRANESFCHIDYPLFPWIGTGSLSPLWVTSPARGQTPCVDSLCCRRLDPCLMHSYAYALVRGEIRAASALAFFPDWHAIYLSALPQLLPRVALRGLQSVLELAPWRVWSARIQPAKDPSLKAKAARVLTPNPWKGLKKISFFSYLTALKNKFSLVCKTFSTLWWRKALCQDECWVYLEYSIKAIDRREDKGIRGR